MADEAAPGTPGARPAAPHQLTVVHEGVTHVFNFAAGSKISALKAQVCAHFIPKEPANDYVLALTEEGVFPESGLPAFQIQPRKLVVPDDEPDVSSEKEASSESGSVSPPTLSPNASLRPSEAKEAQAKLLSVLEDAQAARRASEGERPASAGPGTLVGAASATGSQIEVRLSGGGSRVLRPPELTPSPRVPAKSDPEKNTNEHAVKIVLKEQKAVVFKVERARASSEPAAPQGKLQKEPSREVHRDLKPFDTTALEPGAFDEKEYDELTQSSEAVASTPLPPIEASDECEVVVREDDGKRMVVGGTVDNLLLLFLQSADRDAARDFLYTYPYFTSAAEVLDRVTKLFAAPPAYISEDVSRNIFRSRIVAFMKFWIEYHFYSFARDDSLQAAFGQWVDALEPADPLHGKRYQIVLREALGKQVALSKPKNPSLVEAVGVAMQHPRTGLLGNKKKYKDGKIDGADIVDWLMSNMRIKTRYEAEILGNHLLNQCLWACAGKRAPFKDAHEAYFTLSKPKKDAAGDTAEPEVKLIEKLKDPKQVTMLKLHPTELARQLTLLESDIVKRIKPPELMQSAWKKPNKKELAPGISELIAWFNKINSWVATEIVMNQNLKHRAVTISRFIWAADACRQLGNYNGVMEIISALHLGAIQQLKKTWKEVPEKDMEVFKELSALMNLTDNYRVYREEILKRERERQPLVPYTGVFFQDFLIVEELPDKLANGIVNFQKMRRVAFMIGRLRRYQLRTYNFKPVKCIQEYLQQYLSILSEADLYKWAKMAEGGAGTSMRSPALTVSAPPPPAQPSPSSHGRTDSFADKSAAPSDAAAAPEKAADAHKKGHSRSLSSAGPGPAHNSILQSINPLRASTAVKDKDPKKP